MTTTVNQNYNESTSDHSEHSESPSPPVPRSPRSFLRAHDVPDVPCGINHIPAPNNIPSVPNDVSDGINHSLDAIEMDYLNAPTNANPDTPPANADDQTALLSADDAMGQVTAVHQQEPPANSKGQDNAPNAPAPAPPVLTAVTARRTQNQRRRGFACSRHTKWVLVYLSVMITALVGTMIALRKTILKTEDTLDSQGPEIVERRWNIWAAAETIRQDIPSSNLKYDGDGLCRVRCTGVDGWRVEYSHLSDGSSVYNYHEGAEHSGKEPLEVINDGDGICRVRCSSLDGWRVDYSPLTDGTPMHRRTELREDSGDDFLEEIEDWIYDIDRGYFDDRGYKADNDTDDLAGALLDKHDNWDDDVEVITSTHIRVITLLDVNVITLLNVYTIPVSKNGVLRSLRRT